MKKKNGKICEIIGKNLKRLRIRDNVDQESLGKILQVSREQIHRYEKGLNNPNAISLYLLAQYFDVMMEEFFEDHEEEND